MCDLHNCHKQLVTLGFVVCEWLLFSVLQHSIEKHNPCWNHWVNTKGESLLTNDTYTLYLLLVKGLAVCTLPASLAYELWLTSHPASFASFFNCPPITWELTQTQSLKHKSELSLHVAKRVWPGSAAHHKNQSQHYWHWTQPWSSAWFYLASIFDTESQA